MKCIIVNLKLTGLIWVSELVMMFGSICTQQHIALTLELLPYIELDLVT